MARPLPLVSRAVGERHRRAGDWDDRLLGSYLDQAAANRASKVAVVDGDVRLTYAELKDRVDRVTAALQGLEVGPDDVVAWQLPNWWEALVLHHAIVAAGAISNPLMPILRERELRFTLEQAEARVLVVPERFRGFDHAGLADELARTVPALEHVVVVRPRARARSFARLLGASADEGAPADRSPDDAVLLLYTSGTEAVPKGAVHSHNTLGYEDRSIRDLYSLTADDVVFMPSPVGHITGVLYGLHLPPMLGSAVVFQDVWNPEVALGLIERERCSFVVGATPFLHGLTHSPRLGDHDVSSLRNFACGGADVSPSLVRTATERLGCCVARVYGSTEVPTATGGGPADTLERRAETDGPPIGSTEVRVLDAEGHPVGADVTGELRLRGPDQFLGYLDPALNDSAIDADGWFRSGDLASVDAEGYVVIRGRQKDIIVRGGENISSREVEDLLLEDPHVAKVAIVAMPDPVMVERACAYVVPAPGRRPTLPELANRLEGRGIAKQKLPERLELVEELPMTPSGKVKKFELRARIAAQLARDRAADSAPQV
jgi:cyclohexanecarboxylate-CoA ligase